MNKPFNGDSAKDEKILEMYHHGYTYDQIAKELHVAPNHIASVIRAERTRVDREKRNKQNARALQLFSQGISPLDVCMKLAISADEAFCLHDDYLKLTNRRKLVEIHEDLGKNNLTNMINLYETMKNAGIPREDIIEISKNYFTIPHVRNDLKNLLENVRRQEDKREQYISDWQELNNHNMDLKRENRVLKEENRDLENKNRDLENKNRDLENKNRDLENKNRDLESIVCGKESLNTTVKDPQRAAPHLLGYTEPNSGNKTYTSGNQGLPYLSTDHPSILPTKSSKSFSLDGSFQLQGNSSSVCSCHNPPENETNSIDYVKDLAPSNTRSPDTTISSSTHNPLRKEPPDNPST